MKSVSTLRRRAALVAATVLTLPLLGGTADAASVVTCSYAADTGVVRVDVKGIEASVAFERSMDEELLVNADLCTSSGGKVADLSNIKKVVVRGGSSEQAVVIDFDGGPFTPGRGEEPGGSDEIEFDIALGEGSDYFEIRAYDAGSTVRAGTKDGDHLLNLNPTEATGVDADVQLKGVEQVAFVGAMSDDVFSGSGGRGTGDDFRLSLYLGDYIGGNDKLIGGAGSDQILDSVGNDTDVLRGGAGWDSLESYDQDLTADVIDGQAGSDTCHYDAGDMVSSCEEQPQS
jgi:hypothetical protein